jgi:two-component system cell cycle sensor histidine kinase PleC
MEQLRHIARGGRIAATAAPIFALSNTISYTGAVPVLGVVPVENALAYALLVGVWALSAHLLIRRFEADGFMRRAPREWSYYFIGMFGVGSIVWSMMYFLLWVPDHTINNQSIHLGIIATAMTSLPFYSSHWRVLLAVQFPSILLSAIRFSMGGTGLDEYLLYSLVPFSALILFLCRLEHLKIRDSLEVSFRSERLAHELVRARDEALRQRYDAQAASQAKSAFLANMSHELRTPLNAIIGFSDMIRSEYLGPVGSQRYIEYSRDIHDSGQHLLALINDILDISKIEAGRLEIEPMPLDPTEMLESVMRLTRVRALEKGHTLETKVEAGCPRVFADPRALKQILVNLIGNSIKFTPERGHITVNARHDGQHVEFTVTDTGRGIPEEHIARIFEPFEQIDNRYDRMEGGTGLGLALVKGLVELHKGRFEIESQVGIGTTVRVRLNTVPAEAAAA